MPTLATMFTMTTYGSWLRGDHRGWVDEGKIFPPHPALESADKSRMNDNLWIFTPNELLPTGRAIVHSLRTRLNLELLAFTLQPTHSHFLVAPTNHDVADVAKCAKNAARYHLRPNRRIWTAGYDKRFCFDQPSVTTRTHYIERHNTEHNWPPNIFLLPEPPSEIPHLAPGH
jgi:REP element-mobilizing transposase RayT